MTASAYQRIRLWSGIVSIGSNLGAIWALYFSAAWWSYGLGSASAIAILVVIPFGLAVANLPFEILTGHACETAAGRTEQTLTSWLSDWLRGAIPSAVAQSVGFLLFYFASNLDGPSRWLIAAGVALLIMVVTYASLPLRLARRAALKSSELARYEREVEREFEAAKMQAPRICWVNDSDLTTVNGAIPAFGRILFLSTNVAQQLTPRETMLMVLREVWFSQTGTSRMVVLIAMLWLLAGVLLALGMPGVTGSQTAIGGAAVVTTWCFAALFVWPACNRVWMRQADRFLLTVAPVGEIRDVLAKVQQLNATDTELSTGKAAVFHPIPPVQDRIRALS